MNNQEITALNPNSTIGEDYHGWIHLSAWTGFKSSNGILGEKDAQKESGETIIAHIISASVNNEYILTQAQFNAIKFLKENAELIRDTLLNGLLNEYSNAKEIYEDLMPKIETISDYKNTLEVAFIHIMDSEKGGHAHIGFELECSWDDEHGVGVMMHKDKVVKIGLAEESFNHWNCSDDNGTSENEQIKWANANKVAQRNQKMWWEFWK